MYTVTINEPDHKRECQHERQSAAAIELERRAAAYQHLGDSPANLALCRIHAAARALQAQIDDWLTNHGSDCNCPVCSDTDGVRIGDSAERDLAGLEWALDVAAAGLESVKLLSSAEIARLADEPDDDADSDVNSDAPDFAIDEPIPFAIDEPTPFFRPVSGGPNRG